MMLPSILDIKDPFLISASIAFDVPMADFTLQLSAYDKQLDTSNDKVLYGNYELVEQSSSLVDLQNNDDETFIRQMHQILVDPTQDEEMDNSKFVFAIQEREATLIFNEVAKQEGANSLCLPMIFKMQIQKDNAPRGLSMLAGPGVNIERGEAQILDFKFVLDQSTVLDHDQLTVPFNTKRITAALLLTKVPHDIKPQLARAITLQFVIDDQVGLRIPAVDFNVQEVEIDGHQLYRLEADYEVDLSQERKRVSGAKNLYFNIDLNEKFLYAMGHKDDVFFVSDELRDKLASTWVNVKIPSDSLAKRLIKTKAAGTKTTDTISNIAGLVKRNRDAMIGDTVHKNVKEAIMKGEHPKLKGKDKKRERRERKSALETLRSSVDSHLAKEQSEDEVREEKREKEEFIQKVQVKCRCVHGECEEGSAKCKRCYPGWKGRKCDIPEKHDDRFVANLIDDDEELQAIKRPKKIGEASSNDSGSSRVNKGTGSRSTSAASSSSSSSSHSHASSGSTSYSMGH